MLLGEYEHTLDDKNRLTLPAKFRQALEEKRFLAAVEEDMKLAKEANISID
jgi:DNA-binding transcriptional regulator/RsmH inhibitor MraZ